MKFGLKQVYLINKFNIPIKSLSTVASSNNKSYLDILSNPQSSLKVYGFPLSQPFRSVILLLLTNNISFHYVPVDVFKGEARKETFKEINPNGKVPVIIDNSFILCESGAILQYLCESRKLTKFYADSIQQKALINQWLHWNHSNTRNSTTKLLTYNMFPKLPNADVNKSKGLKDFTGAIKIIENHLIKNKSTFLVGNDITIADIAIITELDQLLPEAFNLFDYNEYPHTLKYIRNTQLRLGESYVSVFNKVIEISKNFTLKQ